jgi:hypothetical protein
MKSARTTVLETRVKTTSMLATKEAPSSRHTSRRRRTCDYRRTRYPNSAPASYVQPEEAKLS